jgi:hypothetical protein
VVDHLRPWTILDVGGPIDYCLELDPSADDGGRTRPLPGLYHGSLTVLRSRDTSRLLEAFLRVLASHDRPAGPGQVRLGLMPLVQDGLAWLAPPASIAEVSDRWMTAQKIQAFHTVSSLVDAADAKILIDPPLGSDRDPASVPFGGWWLPPTAADGARSPGFAVAEVMKLLTDVTVDNAGSSLQAVAMLVERTHPEIAPSTAAEVRAGLGSALERATSA